MNKILHFLAALLLLSCSHETTIEKTEQDKASGLNIHLTDVQIKNAGIVARSLEEMTVSSLLKVNGQIDVPPQNIVSISVPLGGYLHSTHLLPGTRIKKGEVIALIDDQQYIQIQQDYLTAVSRLKFAETDYNRQKALNESKASSDKIFQQTEADFKSELILVKALNEKLKLIGIDPLTLNENTLSRRIRIIAPIEGYVSEVNVNIGKYVNPSDVLFELINPADIHLNLKVFEKDLDKIEIGQKLEANSNSHPEKKYSCKITLISQNFSADRSVSVHCHFENYDKSLIPGMYMNA
ncbi:MAG: efflux RND transporter periplasmic adaptor subunit, partial [Rhodospirillales bacterium]|nr:efflux RND transporter periplasmic adaptor subunit [Rhodospirillales bacterium]